VRARSGAEITPRLDALFADEELAKEQVREAETWERVAAPWKDEGW
jgi:hypothetical protein